MIKEITDELFELETSTDIPVLLDFFSDWCGACESMMPTLEKLSEEYKGKVKFLKVNTTNNKNISRKYRVMGLPTVIILKNNEIMKVLNGFQNKEVFINAINEIL